MSKRDCTHIFLQDDQGKLLIFECIMCNCLYATADRTEAEKIAAQFRTVPA